MSRLIASVILAAILAVPSTGIAGWPEAVQSVDSKVERIRKGRDRVFKSAVEQIVARYCGSGACGGRSIPEVVNGLLDDAKFVAWFKAKILSEVATSDQKMKAWVDQALQPDGVIYMELFREGSPLKKKLDELYAAPRETPMPMPSDSAKTEAVGGSRWTFGSSNHFLLKQQGYFLLSIGSRTEGELGDVEFVALVGPGRDWQRDAHMDFVLGFRAVMVLEMVENFNFRLGATGVLKTGARDGNTRSGDAALHVGFEVEFSRWLLFNVDVGPTWSVREDLAGTGFMLSGGPQFRIF